MQFNYCVYSLHLNAAVEIPGLQPCETKGQKADVDIILGIFPDKIVQLVNQPSMPYYLEPGHEKSSPPHLVVNTLADDKFYHFQYATGAEFVCDQDATVIWGRWQDPFTLEDAALYLLGPILGFILRLRGITCLHASGIVEEGRALAITGPSGSGKSTLAAAFAATGYSILTDDILPLKFEEKTLAFPGYARMRLYPNSFKNIKFLPNYLPPLTSNWDKCYLDLMSNSYSFHDKPVPLKVIYVLDWSNNDIGEPAIVPVNPAPAVPLLAANTYRNELLDSDMRKKEFFFLSRLAALIPVRKVQPLDDITEIPRLIDNILNDFRTL